MVWATLPKKTRFDSCCTSLLGQPLVRFCKRLHGLEQQVGQNKPNHPDLNLSCIKNQMKQCTERQHPGEVGKSISEIDKQYICWFCIFCNGVRSRRQLERFASGTESFPHPSLRVGRCQVASPVLCPPAWEKPAPDVFIRSPSLLSVCCSRNKQIARGKMRAR